MSSMPLEVIFEDNHLLVVNKPSNTIVQGAQPDQTSLLDMAKAYVGKKYQKPGSVFLGVVSRLDRPVSGVVPFARTSKAAARLSEQIRLRTVVKRYWAVVQGSPSAERGTLRHWLARGENEDRTRVIDEPRPGWQEAVMRYHVVSQSGELCCLELDLETGRKHQIRAQLQAIGCPIVGDTRYGGRPWNSQAIALHCRQFSADHPTLKDRMTWQALPPSSWRPWNDWLQHTID